MAYEWDIFISYPRRDPVGPWVQDHFYPLLKRWMGAAMVNPPQVFLDREMDPGTDWPTNLAESLHRSKYMVAIWAPPYFGSKWCIAEWQSMLKREKALKLNVGVQPGLIYPIRFFDGESFPKAARTTAADYTKFNSFPPGRATLRSRTYREFEAEVKRLSDVLASRLKKVPAWNPNWSKAKGPAPKIAKSIAFDQIGLR